MKDIDNPDEEPDEKEVDDKTKDSDWKSEPKEEVKKIKGEYMYCNENDCNYKCTTRSQLDQHAFKGHESNRLCVQVFIMFFPGIQIWKHKVNIGLGFVPLQIAC